MLINFDPVVVTYIWYIEFSYWQIFQQWLRYNWHSSVWFDWLLFYTDVPLPSNVTKESLGVIAVKHNSNWQRLNLKRQKHFPITKCKVCRSKGKVLLSLKSSQKMKQPSLGEMVDDLQPWITFDPSGYGFDPRCCKVAGKTTMYSIGQK